MITLAELTTGSRWNWACRIWEWPRPRSRPRVGQSNRAAARSVIIQNFISGLHVDIALLLKAAIMGIVEGLTEFLPISSTGHLILAGALLGFDDEKAKVFDIAIQTGAIFAVILVYWQKIHDTVLALPSSKEA